MIKFLTRNYSYLSVSLMAEMWQKNDKCQITTGIEDVVIDIDYARHIWRLDEIWIDTVSQKHLSSTHDIFWNFIKRGQKRGNELSIISRFQKKC
jgi:hypothetical protein